MSLEDRTLAEIRQQPVTSQKDTEGSSEDLVEGKEAFTCLNFYLQDTKSSNGTFINSQRLSRGSEESPPCEVLSGDIIQFGVDVTENTRKVTHGCIVSTIKLFLPDGMEARRRS
ncbi:hypothetical protein FQN60_009400, partial [Etheostoma spectabile]